MIKKKRMTLRDVAREAGVSPTAVSFAYNAPHQLSAATRDRILSTAAALGYQPHPVARTLATGRTNTVGFVMPANLNWMLRDPFFNIVLGEMGAVCDDHDMHMLLIPAHSDKVVPNLDTIAVDGFVMVAIHRDHPLSVFAETTTRPVVMLDGDERIQALQINVDDVGGAYAAAKHLLDKGHRRIAVATLGSRPDNAPIPRMERRLTGYRQALADFGLDPDSLQIVNTVGLLSAGDESLDMILALSPRPTALLCTNDVRALGILAAAQARGISVPGDLAVVGFDDLPDAHLASPPLTTVCQRKAERVRKAVDLLMQIIEAEEGDVVIEDAVTPIIYPAELVVRQSS